MSVSCLPPVCFYYPCCSFSLSDINECEVFVTCHAQATCINTPPGSFTCMCNPGYSGDGMTCTGEVALEIHTVSDYADIQYQYSQLSQQCSMQQYHRYTHSFTCDCICDDVGFTSGGVDYKSLCHVANYT